MLAIYKMTNSVPGGELNSTHSLYKCMCVVQRNNGCLRSWPQQQVLGSVLTHGTVKNSNKQANHAPACQIANYESAPPYGTVAWEGIVLYMLCVSN